MPPVEPIISDEAWSAIEKVVERFEECMKSGDNVDLAQFAHAFKSPICETLLAELIKVEMEHGWRRGSGKRVEEYLCEWPAVSERPKLVSDLVEAECLTRTLFAGDEPTQDEVDSRFPGMAEKVRWDFIAGELAIRQQRQSALQEGQHFGRDGRYEIRGLLGRGGMGTVYRAHDTRLDREIALKIPLAAPQLKHAVLERFLREARLAAKIRHPNICPIYDADQVGETFYLTMALIEGQPLSQWIAEHPGEQYEAAVIAVKIARALAAVHAAGFLHRDIKPSNVMIDKSGEPWLMDFGLAGPAMEELATARSLVGETRLTFADNRLTHSKAFLGTLPYMAPELFRGEKASPQSDIYSLGVLLYEMLVRRHPFVADGNEQFSIQDLQGDPTPLRKRRPDVDDKLESICLSALSKDPAERFATAEEMAGELQRYREREAKQVPASPKKRLRLRWISLFILTSVCAAGIMFLKAGATGPTLNVKQWIELKETLGSMTVSHDGTELFVTLEKDYSAPKINVIDTRTGLVKQTINSPKESEHHHGIASSLDGRYLFVPSYCQDVTTTTRIDRHNPAQPDTRDTEGNWSRMIGVTPDGKRLVVVAGGDGRDNDLNNDRLAVADIEDGKFDLQGKSITLDDEAAVFQMVFSADSRLAYFVTVPRKSKSPALCEVALDQPCRVTRKIEFAGSRLTGLAISSSRNRIYVSDADNEQIHIVDLTKFKSIDSWDVAHEIGSLVLNPADDMLAALCPLSREIRVFDPDDGAELGSVIGLRSGAFDLKFSPKGDEIYAIHCEPENCIAVVDTKPLLSKCRIVFSSNRSESGQQLFIVGEDGKDVRQLTHVKGKASLPRWSPDGRKIAFLTNDKGLKICVIKRNGDLVKVFENTDPTLRAVSANFAVMDWAPDGSQIAFIGKEDRAIRAVDVKTGNIRTLFDGSIPGYNMHVSLTWDSRDGSLLVASRGQDTSDRFVISRFEPKTKEFRPIFRSDELSYTFNGPAVSPVGDKIAVFRQDKNKPAHAQPLYLLNSKGGDPQALASTGTTINSYPRWTTRGSSLVYAGRDRKQTHVYLLRLPDGKPDQLTRGDCDDFAPDVWGEPDGE